MFEDILKKKPDALDELDSEIGNQDELLDIALDQIEADPDQDRKDFESDDYQEYFSELRASVRANGIREPIKLLQISKRKFKIIEGENRWRAAKAEGLRVIPAIVRKNISFEQALNDQLIENLNRRNLSPYEEALAFERRLSGGMSEGEFMKTFGKKAPWISKRKTLLKAPDDVLRIARTGKVRNIDTLNSLAKKPEEQRNSLITLIDEGRFQAKMLDDGESHPKPKKKGSKKVKSILIKPHHAAHILNELGVNKEISHDDLGLIDVFNEYLEMIEDPN